MKTITEILFFAPRGGSMEILKDADCGSDVATIHEGSFDRDHTSAKLEDTDSRIERLLQILQEHGTNPGIIRDDIFTQEELESARLIYLSTLDKFEVDGDVGWKTAFELTDTCRSCCAGARQLGPYLLPIDELPKLEGHRLMTSYWGHLLVDERLADALVAANLSGLAFHQVYAVSHEGRQMKLRWKQLDPTNVLPRMSPKTTGMYRSQECKICERDGHCGSQAEPLRMVYRASDLETALDVNSTWEGFYFGCVGDDGLPVRISVPRMLVTPKVWRVFRDAGVTEVDFLPIRVDEG